MMQPLHNWIRLEDDAATRNQIMSDVVAARTWPEHENTKNSFFFFMYGAWDDTAYGPQRRSALRSSPAFRPRRASPCR